MLCKHKNNIPSKNYYAVLNPQRGQIRYLDASKYNRKCEECIKEKKEDK